MNAVLIDRSRGCLVVLRNNRWELPRSDEHIVDVTLRPFGSVGVGYFELDEPIEGAAFVPRFEGRPMALYMATVKGTDVPDKEAYNTEVGETSVEALREVNSLLPDRVATWYACLLRRTDIPSDSDYVWGVLRRLAKTCTGHFEQSGFYEESVEVALNWKHNGTYEPDSEDEWNELVDRLREVTFGAPINLELKEDLVTYRVDDCEKIQEIPRRDVLAVALDNDCYGGNVPPTKHIVKKGATVFPMFIFEDEDNLAECEVVVFDVRLNMVVFVDYT